MLFHSGTVNSTPLTLFFHCLPTHSLQATSLGRLLPLPLTGTSSSSSCCRLLGRRRLLAAGSLNLVALDSVNDPQTRRLPGDRVDLLLEREPLLRLGLELVEADELALLEGVVGGEAHLLDPHLALRELVLAEDQRKRHAVLLGRLELLRELGLDLVEELGLAAVVC